MKKLVLFSEESLLSGNVKCGIAEVVDSLALSLVNIYDVWIICKEGSNIPSKHLAHFVKQDDNLCYTKVMNINYYVVKEAAWEEYGAKIIDRLSPDILHNFCEPTLLSKLSKRPPKCVFTFDDLDFLKENFSFLKEYDALTTFSYGYWEYIKSQLDDFAKKLSECNFIKTRCGIITEVFNPATGLFLKEPYSSAHLDDKQISRKQLRDFIQWEGNGPIFLTMGNISYRKGADFILQAATLIHQNGGRLVIFGNVSDQYQKELQTLIDKNIVFYHSKVGPANVLPILAGADFYLQPSRMESGGLMPMTASRYGVVPIVTQNGGFKDNFDETNAIIIKNGIDASIKEAFDLYRNYLNFMDKQKICMSQDFSWNTRKKEYIEIYESEGERK